MSYRVKEIFVSLQGEGAQAGRAAVFLRFAGCNVTPSWSCAAWCDTDFLGGRRYPDASALAEAVAHAWPGGDYVVCTGGEPLLQLDPPLIEALHERGFQIALETNGTLEVPPGLDWVCVSPKAFAPLVQRSGDELKLVYPQEGLDPSAFAALPFGRHFLQPKDGPEREANTRAAIAYCQRHPQWRLSLQTHKLLGIP